MADETRPDTPQPPPNPAAIQTDETGASTVYSNFCRVSLTPEEMVLSFGLNTQLQITEPIKTTHRVVMNFYTAKRLMNALINVVNAHEAAYGVLELDFQRRARGMGVRPGAPPRPGGGPT